MSPFLYGRHISESVYAGRTRPLEVALQTHTELAPPLPASAPRRWCLAPILAALKVASSRLRQDQDGTPVQLARVVVSRR